MTADKQEVDFDDVLYDINGRSGKVINRYVRKHELWVTIEYEYGGTREAPEACFFKVPRKVS